MKKEMEQNVDQNGMENQNPEDKKVNKKKFGVASVACGLVKGVKAVATHPLTVTLVTGAAYAAGMTLGVVGMCKIIDGVTVAKRAGYTAMPIPNVKPALTPGVETQNVQVAADVNPVTPVIDI